MPPKLTRASRRQTRREPARPRPALRRLARGAEALPAPADDRSRRRTFRRRRAPRAAEQWASTMRPRMRWRFWPWSNMRWRSRTVTTRWSSRPLVTRSQRRRRAAPHRRFGARSRWTRAAHDIAPELGRHLRQSRRLVCARNGRLRAAADQERRCRRWRLPERDCAQGRCRFGASGSISLGRRSSSPAPRLSRAPPRFLPTASRRAQPSQIFQRGRSPDEKRSSRRAGVGRSPAPGISSPNVSRSSARSIMSISSSARRRRK